jgi:hypothetical protein
MQNQKAGQKQLMQEYNTMVQQKKRINDVESDVNRIEVKKQVDEAQQSLYNEKANRNKTVQKYQNEMQQDYQEK